MSIRRPILTLSTRDSRAIVGNFYAADQYIQKEIQRVVKKYGRMQHDETYRRTPKRTHFMANNIHLHFSDNYTVYEVGWRERDFLMAGKNFYPLFVEFGTRFMAAQSPLFRSKEVVHPQFVEEMSRVLSRAAKRAARGRK